MPMKHVAALKGDTIYRRNHTIFINKNPVAIALKTDRTGRPLPLWQDCIKLTEDQVFLLNGMAADSFGGRYFGAVSITAIIGKAVPVYIPNAANMTEKTP